MKIKDKIKKHCQCESPLIAIGSKICFNCSKEPIKLTRKERRELERSKD